MKKHTLQSVLAHSWLSYALWAFFASVYLMRIGRMESQTTFNSLGTFIGLTVGSFGVIGLVYICTLSILKEQGISHSERISINVVLAVYAVLHVLIGIVRDL